MTKGQLVSVQMLRAAAALAVLALHLPFTAGEASGSGARDIFWIGENGVDLFFVISGFIICYTTQADWSVRTFIVKRIVRIVPVYYALTLAIFLVAAAAPQLLNSTTTDVGGLVKSLLFIPYMKDSGAIQPVLFVGWTLNYEMFFYAVFAVALLAGRRRIFAAVGLLVAAYVFGRIYESSSVPVRFFTDGIILEFVWGCLAYVAVSRAPPQAMAVARRLWPVPAVMLLGQLLWEPDLPREISKGIPAGLLLFCAATITPPRNLVTRFFERVGDASYSLYLSHAYVVQALIKVLLPIVGISALSLSAVGVVSLVGSLVLAFCLFAWLERPSNVWLRARLLPVRDRNMAPA